MGKGVSVVVAVLIVLLALSLGYIGYSSYSARSLEKQVTLYQQGMQEGYEQGIIQVAQQAASCQQVPLRIGNQTLNIVAVECLQAQAPAA